MQFIYIIIIYLVFWIRFRKELLYYVYVENFLCLLVTFLVIVVCRYNYDLKYKQDNFILLLKVVFNVLYSKKIFLGLFFYATSTLFFSNLRQV